MKIITGSTLAAKATGKTALRKKFILTLGASVTSQSFIVFLFVLFCRDPCGELEELS